LHNAGGRHYATYRRSLGAINNHTTP
jgi:hypothetical protein